MTNKIDTDMTASYLNAVQSEIIKANETITKLEGINNELQHDLQCSEKEVDRLRKLVDSLRENIISLETQVRGAAETNARLVSINERLTTKMAQFDLGRVAGLEWHPSTESPQNDERVIVRTNEGATFMYEPCNGKWPKWVEKWMYIPQ